MAASKETFCHARLLRYAVSEAQLPPHGTSTLASQLRIAQHHVVMMMLLLLLLLLLCKLCVRIPVCAVLPRRPHAARKVDDARADMMST